jgi:hypothetical protein
MSKPKKGENYACMAKYIQKIVFNSEPFQILCSYADQRVDDLKNINIK